MRPALARIEAALQKGAYAAGYLAYEAASAFDPALCTHPPDDLPLLWFGLYAEPIRIEAPPACEAEFSTGDWTSLLSEEDYRRAIEEIRGHIGAGDSYQVNYTFPMQTAFTGHPYAWFLRLCEAQGTGYCAYVDSGRFQVLSASPRTLLFPRRRAPHHSPHEGHPAPGGFGPPRMRPSRRRWPPRTRSAPRMS